MMFSKRYPEILIYFALLVAVLFPRLPALDTFSTLDEPYWLSMGANFYYALGQREFQNTVYEYQPAVTTMWVVTAAMLVYFPEYRGLGQGYLEFEKGALDPFMLEHGKDPLMLLYEARLIQVLVITGLFLLLYFLLQRIVSKSLAFFAVLFASFDPFFLGQSRLLDHEAMLSLFVLVSVASLYIYFFLEHHHAFLILSAVMAGLAQLTKSSAIAILLPVGVLFLLQLYHQREKGFAAAAWASVKTFAVWVFILGLTYFVFWPGMWVAPQKMLHEVYGNAFSYAFQGARLKATGEANVFPTDVEVNFSGVLELLQVFFWRTTPFTWLGILFAIFFLFFRTPQPLHSPRQFFVLWLVTGGAFVLLFGIAQGRNSPHYILTSYLAFNLFAAIGWFQMLIWLVNQNGKRLALGLSLLGLLQIASAVFFFFPYYYTYRNPILYASGQHRDFPQFAYGEGLEDAAHYLANLPEAEGSTALVYYARGCFSYFYPGQTTRFKPYFVEPNGRDELLEAMQSADFLVMYYASQGSQEKYINFLDKLSPAQPIHEIWLNDYKYVLIYRVSDFPPSVFEALAREK